jgi:cellulose synthase/poly-beta-1,6-N-acetylglucosamine synthase-like glycosyltransferase
MDVYFSIWLSLYLVFLVLLFLGWEYATQKGFKRHDPVDLSVTVVVPFRNEGDNLIRLLHYIRQLKYPVEKYEVVWVNDHSEDNAAEVLRARIPENHKVLDLPEGKEGKKQALTLGIAGASGEVILTTDADCRVPNLWIRHMVDVFSDPDLKMITGPVRVGPDIKWWETVQAIEFSALVGAGAASLAWGVPTMANGANLAFRKSVFDEVGGWEDNMGIPSGDDEYLLGKVHDRYPSGVRFLNIADAEVITPPITTLKEFFYQRVRWASKWNKGKKGSPQNMIFASFVLWFQLSYLLLFVWLLAGAGTAGAGWFIVFKLIPEGVWIRRVCAFLGISWSLTAFLFLQIVYPVYALAVGLQATFGGFRWKGRRV